MRQSYLNRLHALALALPREHRVVVRSSTLQPYVIPNTDPEALGTPENLEATCAD